MPRNIRTRQYTSGVLCCFLSSQISSNFMFVLEVFAAQWKRDMRKYIQVQQGSILKATWYGMQSVSDTFALYLLPSKTAMNGTCYIKLLKLRLHIKIHLCSILVHDSVLCHKSKAVRSIFRRSKFRLLTGQIIAQIWTQKGIYREIWKIKWQKNSYQVLWNLLKS